LISNRWRDGLAVVGRFLVIAAIVAPSAVRADPIKTTLTAAATDGYARLVFTMSEYTEATVRLASSVLIISFKKPIDVSLERLSSQVPDYVSAARRDPDGTGVRLALARPVKINTTSAGEKFFVDLLPATWTGVPPGLPQAVIEDLARRAREADRLMRKEHEAMQKQMAPVRVHVASQPTFTRYVFDVPPEIEISSDHAKDRLTLTFDAPFKFDLADAEAALPQSVSAIDAKMQDTSTVVHFALADKVDVRTFRDGPSYIVDIETGEPKPNPLADLSAAIQQAGAPQSAPAATTTDGATKPALSAIAQKLSAASTPQGAAATDPVPAKPIAPPVAPPRPAAAIEAPVAPVPPPLDNSPTPVKPVAQMPVAQMPAAPPADAPPAAAQAPPQILPAAPPAKAPAPVAPQQAAAPPAHAAGSPAASASAPASGAVAPAPMAAAAPAAPPAPVNLPHRDPVAAAGADGGKLVVELAHQAGNLKLSFPFTTPTAGAVFARADTLWIVFDSVVPIDLSELKGDASGTIGDASFVHTADADIIRLKLDHPHLSSVSTDGPAWTVQIGDRALEATRALDITRNLIGHNRSSVTIPFDEPHLVHRLDDPQAGDQLIVVTGYAPARGFVNTKDFVEFRALASTQGVAVEPLADDVRVELAPDKIVITRPTGLTLSTSVAPLLRGKGLRPVMFDSALWGADRQASYLERQSNLIAAAAAAPENMRLAPRLDLARFYIARDMYPEAKGVLDVALTDERPAADDVSAIVLRAVSEIMMNRPEAALKDLADPVVGDQHDAPLWRALAYARQGKWAQAREGFKNAAAAVATLPVELQRAALKEEMRSAIEVGDFSGASHQLNDFETIGVPHDMEPAIAVLIGRLAEGLGRTEDALAAYQTAADSWDRRAAAQGQLRETVLRYTLGDLKRDDVISELETLTTIWRGDETEIEGLQILARLYTEEGRYRDAFYVMRSAMTAHPDWDMTRRIQQEAAATFDALFLAGKGDSLPAIEALALFYDFRELTPIGRRGDEMIRRLADRLVSVDLLDQAAELLQYQVDNRLQGAARAQVATRLAVIYLMNRKADRALAVLRSTRSADLSNDLRDQRLLLEARALSDTGRHDLALEVIADVDGRAAIRLRSDIYWADRRWRQAAEQIELMYGERWKEWQPLNDVERADILRAEVGYALAEDALGLGRFREKYAAKMAQTPDAHVFDVAASSLSSNGTEFGDIAHAAAATDTLDGFLRDLQARYPESSAIPPTATPPDASAAAPAPAAAAPAIGPAPSGPLPPPRAAGRTAQR
jgi:tetratricopeptide (TPR) repeat protein